MRNACRLNGWGVRSRRGGDLVLGRVKGVGVDLLEHLSQQARDFFAIFALALCNRADGEAPQPLVRDAIATWLQPARVEQLPHHRDC